MVKTSCHLILQQSRTVGPLAPGLLELCVAGLSDVEDKEFRRSAIPNDAARSNLPVSARYGKI